MALMRYLNCLLPLFWKGIPETSPVPSIIPGMKPVGNGYLLNE